jgi:putative transposase
MNRSNLFSLAPTREQHRILEELAVNCGKLWNEVNYLCCQQYENYLRLDWNPQVYKKYVPFVGSATAQQIVRKNNEAWRGFLALKRMEKVGKLPSTIKRVNPPGYWKREGRYVLRILLTFDKDFGNLVFKAGVKAKGVLLLRFRPSSPEQIAQKLKALIATGIQLEGQFVVVNEQRVRVSRLGRLRRP